MVNVIDIFLIYLDLSPGFYHVSSGNDVLLVGNKKDILLKSQLSGKISSSGSWNVPMKKVFVLDVVLTSAQNKHAIKEKSFKIEHYTVRADVYVVGVTNVGKSTLINAIISKKSRVIRIITTSRFPGTTFWTK